MNARLTLLTSMMLMAVNIAIGAFGAHALKDKLIMLGRTDTFELAMRYSFYHALGLMLLGLLMDRFPRLQIASGLLIGGVIFFSGSLLVLSLTNQTWLGAVTPVGGLLMIAGWTAAGWVIFTSKR